MVRCPALLIKPVRGVTTSLAVRHARSTAGIGSGLGA
jgi:hypothetical protein